MLSDKIGLTLIIGFCFSLYMIPTIVAFRRRTTNRIPVMIINFFLGFSLVGWVIALAMSFNNDLETRKTK